MAVLSTQPRYIFIIVLIVSRLLPHALSERHDNAINLFSIRVSTFDSVEEVLEVSDPLYMNLCANAEVCLTIELFGI